MAKDHFGEPVAERYDESEADMFEPAVVDPVVDFLADLAGHGAALELGIGTGRIALPLTQRGVRVHGIDLSAAMVARLRAKPGGEDIGVTIGDFATTTVGGTFSVAYVVFNTVMNLTTQDEQVACFQNVAAHLEPGGCFVIEVGVPELQRLPPGETVRAFHVSAKRLGFDEYDVGSQGLISHHYSVVDGKLEVNSVPFRYVWPSELDLMARLAGMTLRERWSGWRREPFTSDSTKHVSVWEKTTSRSRAGADDFRRQAPSQGQIVSSRLIAARSFMAGHARVLDRRRFGLLFVGADAEPVLAALRAYRNPDGGYGHGLEPDLRAPESQPAAALHAFEVFADLAPVTAPEAVELCDWLDGVSLPDGGLPFALPIEDASGCAPFWAQADPRSFSLQITTIVAAHAHRVAAHDPEVAAHPWLARSTSCCLAAIDALDAAPAPYELAFAVRFLDAVHDRDAAAPGLLARLGEYVPDDGRLRVIGGRPDETLWPLDLAPEPGRPARTILDKASVAADLERLACEQDEDGGWSVDFQSYSPAAALEWRGYATVRALSVLRDNAMIDAPARHRPARHVP